MRRILFVCTGNICRSPMAEGILRAALAEIRREPGWTIDSAGIHAVVGHPPAPLAVKVAAQYGADIRALASRPFTSCDFERFDDIIAMDRGHLDHLSFLRPPAFAGTLALMRAANGRDWLEVPDPYGGSSRDFKRAGRLIAEGIGAMLGQLLEQPSAEQEQE